MVFAQMNVASRNREKRGCKVEDRESYAPMRDRRFYG
jgi:hypothetical protein